MAVNLAKICADLTHPDPQIKTFALMSITRLSRQLVDAPAEIREIAARLRPLSSSENPDVVFLARKAFNHIDSHFRECLEADGGALQPLPEAAPPPPPVVAALAPTDVPAVSPIAAAAPEAAPTPAVVAVPVIQETAAVEAVTPALPPSLPAVVAPPPPAAALRDPSSLGREEILLLLPSNQPATYTASLLIQIASKGQAEDLALVRPLLGHADDRVRANAIEVYERIATPSHIEELLPMLGDRNNRARGNAVTALARLGYEGIEGAVTDMLAQPALSMRETAVYVLSKLENPFVERLLLQALSDPYDGVRLRATKALTRFPTRASVTGLKRMLNDLDINICEAAAESLRSIKALLQSQRAGLSAAVLEVEKPETAPESPAPAGSGESAIAQPATPSPPQPAPPAPIAAPSGGKTPPPDELFRALGTEIYQLCRLNLITHEHLDNVFYEVLRYQDFLRNYMVRRGDPEDETRRSAVEHLQEKIQASFTQLGRQASELLGRQQLALPAAEGGPVRAILADLEKAGGIAAHA